jgi:hypothetical protein
VGGGAGVRDMGISARCWLTSRWHCVWMTRLARGDRAVPRTDGGRPPLRVPSRNEAPRRREEQAAAHLPTRYAVRLGGETKVAV